MNVISNCAGVSPKQKAAKPDRFEKQINYIINFKNMKKIILILTAFTGLIVMSGCSKNGAIFTFTPDNRTLRFEITAQKIVVDWGDGLTNEYNNLKYTEVKHRYTDNTTRTVRIQEEKLSYFDCSSHAADDHKNITVLNVDDCAALRLLNCSNNQLTNLDVSKNTVLSGLYCFDNQLSTLDISNNTKLAYLRCFDNQLKVLDVSNNTELKDLYCSSNQLSALDVSNNTELKDLRCSGNQLNTLDISNNTALTALVCFDNQLSALDVSNNTMLTQLLCSSNQLSALDVSNNTELTELWCYRNQLSADALNTIFTDLPNYSNTSISGEIRIANNPGSATCDRSIATAKGWTVIED
jgi:hypothetical protein